MARPSRDAPPAPNLGQLGIFLLPEQQPSLTLGYQCPEVVGPRRPERNHEKTLRRCLCAAGCRYWAMAHLRIRRLRYLHVGGPRILLVDRRRLEPSASLHRGILGKSPLGARISPAAVMDAVARSSRPGRTWAGSPRVGLCRGLTCIQRGQGIAAPLDPPRLPAADEHRRGQHGPWPGSRQDPRYIPTVAWAATDAPDYVGQKESREPRFIRISRLLWVFSDPSLVEVGGIEPPSEGTPSPVLHA